MTNSEGKPSLVIKLRMATSTAAPGSTSPKLKSKTPNQFQYVLSINPAKQISQTVYLLTYSNRTLYDTIIYVNVGPTQERFGIHKSLLCHHSSYFKAALEGGFEESETQVINLKDEDPKVFWGFNEWLYSGTVAHQRYATNEKWSALLDLYVFAEKRIVPKLQNALIDAMINLCGEIESYPKTEIHLAWVNTATSSPLHELLGELYARDVSMDECFGQEAEERECFDVDFVMRVAIALDKYPGASGNGLWEDRCLWHVHGPEDPPCRDDDSLTGSE